MAETRPADIPDLVRKNRDNMPTTNEDFFTRERMQAIGLGIGKGFQSYDPNNPFAGAGAAIETTIGAQMLGDQKRKAADERKQELADIEAKQIRDQDRAEQAKIREENRVRDNALKDQEAQLKRFKNMRVGIVDAKKTPADWAKFSEWFARTFGGDTPRIKGPSPTRLLEPGDPAKWDSSMDAVDPYGEEIMRGVR
jgi:hypothetical protein